MDATAEFPQKRIFSWNGGPHLFAGFWELFWISLAVKLAIATYVPLSNDEAYYWVWGQTPALSYYDHPPFVAWLFAIAPKSEFLRVFVRWPAVWFGHLTILIWGLILTRHLTGVQAQWWTMLMLLCPLTGLGLIIVTPDLPLMVWWSLSVLLFLRCLDDANWWKCFALGLSLGLGFLSKYHIVLFVPCALVSVAISEKWSVLRGERLLAVFFGGMLGCMPVLLWNMQHNWISFSYQLHHGLAEESFRLIWPVEYVMSQILILFPPVFSLALRRPVSSFAKILLPFAWGPLLFILFTSFRSEPEANWPIVAYPAVFVLAVQGLTDLRWIQRTVIVWGVAITGLLVLVAPIIPAQLRVSKIRRLHEYEELARSLAGRTEVFASSYQMASQLSFQLEYSVSKLRGLRRVDHFDFQDASQPTTERFYLVVKKAAAIEQVAAVKDYEIVKQEPITKDFDLVEFRQKCLARGGTRTRVH